MMTEATINWSAVLKRYDVVPDELQIHFLKENPKQIFEHRDANIHEDIEGFADMFDFDSVGEEILIEYLRETVSDFEGALIKFILSGEDELYPFLCGTGDENIDREYRKMQYEYVRSRAPIIADYAFIDYRVECTLHWTDYEDLEDHPEVTGKPYPDDWFDNWLSKYLPSRESYNQAVKYKWLKEGIGYMEDKRS